MTVFVLMNLVRPVPLILDPDLSHRAQIRAEYLCETGQWSHAGWEQSFQGIKYTIAGENLARKFKSAKKEFDALRNSPPHNANIMHRGYTHVGVGHACNVDVYLFKG